MTPNPLSTLLDPVLPALSCKKKPPQFAGALSIGSNLYALFHLVNCYFVDYFFAFAYAVGANSFAF